jgi:pimeloyl-ACP methyl ester carboxylesterase
MAFRKLSVRVGIALLIFLLACLIGFLYNMFSQRHYRQIAGVPGKLYDVDGYAMSMYCTGQGSPTIILASGLGDDFTIWRKVQPVLSQQTRVCSYDRAGFGWSEPRAGAHDAKAVVEQLHKLLEAASIEKPFVLAGHSISGLYLREYAAQYRGDLAGMALIDGSSPSQDDHLTKELAAMQEQSRRDMPRMKLLMELGFFRALGYCTDSSPGLGIYEKWIDADTCVPSRVDAMENELDAARTSEQETLHAGPFGDLPILILSRDPNALPPNLPAAIAKPNSVMWDQMQEESKELSGQSRRIIAKGSGHYIQIDRPDLVNREISAFVAMVRNHQTFENNHSTTVE